MKFFKCPCCSKLHFTTVNGLTFENDFITLFRKSPVKGLGRERFIRNVCVAIGNTGTHSDIPHLKEALTEESLMIREHAQWAINTIKSR